MNARRGLTLTELLVATSLISLISGATMATFAGGISVWERIQQRGFQGQWMQVGVDQLRRDLRNIRPFTPIPFTGVYDQVSFAGLVPAEPPDERDRAAWAGVVVPGRVAYYFDDRQHRLCRSQHDYRGLRRFCVRDACSTMMEELERVKFSYRAFDPELEVGTWASSWESVTPPRAVKLELTYRDRVTQKPVTQIVVIAIPSGS